MTVYDTSDALVYCCSALSFQDDHGSTTHKMHALRECWLQISSNADMAYDTTCACGYIVDVVYSDPQNHTSQMCVYHRKQSFANNCIGNWYWNF